MFYEKSVMLVFKGRKHVLSNNYPCSILFQGIWFVSAEQAFRYKQALFFENKDLANLILHKWNHSSEFRYKLHLKPFRQINKWKVNQINVMRDILESKFNCVQDYRNVLLKSKGKIVCASPGETFWSSGLSKSETFSKHTSAWIGANTLGKLHMQLRAEKLALKHILSMRETQLEVGVQQSSKLKQVTVNLENLTVSIFGISKFEAYRLTDSCTIPRQCVSVFTKKYF